MFLYSGYSSWGTVRNQHGVHLWESNPGARTRACIDRPDQAGSRVWGSSRAGLLSDTFCQAGSVRPLWRVWRRDLAITDGQVQKCVTLLPSLYWSGEEACCGQTIWKARLRSVLQPVIVNVMLHVNMWMLSFWCSWASYSTSKCDMWHFILYLLLSCLFQLSESECRDALAVFLARWFWTSLKNILHA